MRKILLIVLLLVLYVQNGAKSQALHNSSFDFFDSSGNPLHWSFDYAEVNRDMFRFNYDPKDRVDGRFSMYLRQNSDDTNRSVIVQYIQTGNLKASTVTLKGYVKSDKDRRGRVGLSLRIFSGDDLLQSRTVWYGDTASDWQFIEVSLPFDDEHAELIEVAGAISGNAGARFDDFGLFADSLPIAAAPQKIFPASSDTSFASGSGISLQNLDEDHLKWLWEAGIIWGMLKYHHPVFTRGQRNADAALVRLINLVVLSKGKKQWHRRLYGWLTGLGLVDSSGRRMASVEDSLVIYRPSYGSVFARSYYKNNLYRALQNIIRYSVLPAKQYYVCTPDQVGNVSFTNERCYREQLFPDDGIRLVALFRYWAMVNYFYPYRSSIGDWDRQLEEMIPVFIRAKNNIQYTKACLRLIATIHDSHGFVSSSKTLDTIAGIFTLPVNCTFINDTLVIARNYPAYGLNRGDLILAIDDIAVKDLTCAYKDLLSSSNEASYLRDISSPLGFLLRSNDSMANLKVRRDHEVFSIRISKVPVDKTGINSYNELSSVPPPASSYRWLADSIGYIYTGLLNAKDFKDLKQEFDRAHGIVIDLRCYPSYFVPYHMTDWLKGITSAFCKVAVPSLAMPGLIYYKKDLVSGNAGLQTTAKRIVILVNEFTQSQAEFTAMALASIPGALVVGTTTAGADGNYTKILLPGGLSTGFSGTGIYYPDGGGTQRSGVRIDRRVPVTVDGIREGRDEQLEAAVKILENK